MPEMDGLELQDELNRRDMRLPFVVVTAYGDVPLAVRAVQAGAIDVVEKPFQPTRLLSAVDRALTRRGELDAKRAEHARARDSLALLTEREKEIFDLVVQGKSSKDVGRELGISNRTVDIYRRRLARKLKLKSVTDAVRLALSAQV
jgi:two-component system response regulator FixJ